MNIESEVFSLSNKIRFYNRYQLTDIVFYVKFIIDDLKNNTKEFNIYILDEMLSKYRNILSNKEFETLKGGINTVKTILFLYYNDGNIFDFIEDCLKEIIKKELENNRCFQQLFQSTTKASSVLQV